MQRKKKGEVEWLEFDLLAEIPELVHGVFLRGGGVSGAPFHSLNAGGGSGDNPLNVDENRKIIQDTLGLPSLISGHQKHGVNIACPQDDLSDCDGLLTEQPGIGLIIKHADCQAAIFYDPIHRAVANVHCGWRGNVQNIYAAAVKAMQAKMGSRPEDLLVCISPSLGPDVSEFKNYKTELPESFWPFQIKPTYFNLWEISRHQLLECGILPHHIEIASLCTYAHKQDFFSYRRDKVTGRNATIVAIYSN